MPNVHFPCQKLTQGIQQLSASHRNALCSLQSLVAERHKIVDRLPQAAEPSYKLLWARITRWRGARGLLTCPSPALGSQHLGCSKRGPFVELLGGLYMCEGCGWAHQCGDSCPEKLVDEVSQSLVCPISGRCFDRMMLDWEVGTLLLPVALAAALWLSCATHFPLSTCPQERDLPRMAKILLCLRALTACVSSAIEDLPSKTLSYSRTEMLCRRREGTRLKETLAAILVLQVQVQKLHQYI